MRIFFVQRNTFSIFLFIWFLFCSAFCFLLNSIVIFLLLFWVFTFYNQNLLSMCSLNVTSLNISFLFLFFRRNFRNIFICICIWVHIRILVLKLLTHHLFFIYLSSFNFIGSLNFSLLFICYYILLLGFFFLLLLFLIFFCLLMLSLDSFSLIIFKLSLW